MKRRSFLNVFAWLLAFPALFRKPADPVRPALRHDMGTGVLGFDLDPGETIVLIKQGETNE